MFNSPVPSLIVTDLLDSLIYKYTYNFKVGIRMPVQDLQHKTHNKIKVEIINV